MIHWLDDAPASDLLVALARTLRITNSSGQMPSKREWTLFMEV
jgi:hypothetical protein